jgi:hypothetical protein
MQLAEEFFGKAQRSSAHHKPQEKARFIDSKFKPRSYRQQRRKQA